jgi:hypothetical protein
MNFLILLHSINLKVVKASNLIKMNHNLKPQRINKFINKNTKIRIYFLKINNNCLNNNINNSKIYRMQILLINNIKQISNKLNYLKLNQINIVNI